jgi:hypothetical protein
MNEKIIEALMQLFALIAEPQRNEAERKRVVEAYLRHQLNQGLVNKYLNVYSQAYNEAQERLEKSTPERREGAIAIRITKLCKDINEEAARP